MTQPRTTVGSVVVRVKDMDRWLGDGGMALIATVGAAFDDYGVDGEDLGWASGTFVPTAAACNPHGIVQAGVHGLLHDAAMNFAINAALPGRDRTKATLEMKVETMRPALLGADYLFRGEVVRMARQVAYGEAVVRDGEERLVSRATGTFLLHRADDRSARPSGDAPGLTGVVPGSRRTALTRRRPPFRFRAGKRREQPNGDEHRLSDRPLRGLRARPPRGFAHCFCCTTIVEQLAMPLVPVVAMTEYRIGDRMHGLLRGYKDAPSTEARASRRSALAALVELWLAANGDAVRARFSGGWDLVTAVPSSCGRRRIARGLRSSERCPGSPNSSSRSW